jgi:hypothetical protein
MGKTASLANIGTIADSSLGFRNRIINGAMVIDQRNAGASFTVGNLGYGIDRWLTQAVTASGTGQQVAGSTGNNKALRITGASGNTAIQVSQRIESVNIYDCASQTVSVSFTLSGSTSGTVSVRFLYPTATDNYTSTTEPVAGTSVSFTTTPTQYTVSRTLDSNANKGVWVLLDFGAVGASVTRTIEFFQLEKGSTATSFDYRPIGTELQLCQRYFEKSFQQATAPVQNGGSTGAYRFVQVVTINTRQICCGTAFFKVTKRATPTVTLFNPEAANALPRNLQRALDWTTGGLGTVAASESVLVFNDWTSASSGGAGDDFTVQWTASSEL